MTAIGLPPVTSAVFLIAKSSTHWIGYILYLRLTYMLSIVHQLKSFEYTSVHLSHTTHNPLNLYQVSNKVLYTPASGSLMNISTYQL
jgi:hypothetical protein